VNVIFSHLILSNPLSRVAKHHSRSLSLFCPQNKIIANYFADVYNPGMIAFLPKSVAFLPKSLAFLIKSVAFLPKSLAFLPKSVAFLPKSLAFLIKSVAFLPKSAAFLPKSVAFSPMFVAFSPVLIAFPGRHFHGFRYNSLKNSATPAFSEVITVAAANVSLYTYILLLRATVLLHHKRLISLNLIINQLK
jgi:hypothetical protein